MLIVGSKAFSHNFPSANRKVKDIDLIGYKSDVEYLKNALHPNKIKEGDGIVTLIDIQNKNEFYNTKNVEVLLADNSKALQSYIEYEQSNGKLGNVLHWASPEVLFSMKKSHIHFPVYFEKHIGDYTFLKEKMGDDILKDITKIHYKEVEERIGKLKTPSLNKKITEFFGQSKDFVKSYFVHDDIHKSVAHYHRPLYLEMQKDITMAKCEKDMWEGFTFENKCKCVLEEAYVIALERKVLPSIFGSGKWNSSKESLDWALMRICTNLCSGWFRQFATDNYFKIRDYVDNNYVEKFLEKYNSSQICRIQ